MRRGTREKMFRFGHVTLLCSILLLLKSIPVETTTECPALFSTEWQIKEALKNCTPPKMYHCLLTMDNRNVIDICLIPSIIPAGHRTVFDVGTSMQKLEKCPHDTFQPSKRWSNETLSMCNFYRSDCNGEGELEYLPGNETSDCICRCDYKRDYVELNYRQRASVGFSKLHSDVYCIHFPCSGTRLSNYSCVEKCPEGMHYPDDSGQCQNNRDPTSTTITSVSVHITNASHTSFNVTFSTAFPMNRNDVEPLKFILPIGIILLLLIVSGIIIVKCRRKCWPKKIKGDWWNLAKELGLTDAEIERIKADHSTSQKQCYNALCHWKKKNYDTRGYWVKRLLQACRDAKVDHMDKVEEIFKEKAPLLTNDGNRNDIQEHIV
ncbi:hypothetical protein CHS0354_031085 [Potamilus streckersoni]|uniref:Death domain-containing protein n=1 Tax=Potamilus streckersoni TaxID=2493646 RepID=A0AAE0VLU6_9BIVA|nr:hypothetical protein CHS0354_031085 [Potamilus streckersoni]